MNKTNKAKTHPSDPVKDAGGGKTKVEQGGEPAPRLPHERDQSSESQQTQDGQPTKVGRQAHEDVERGLVDTDRGLEANRVYDDNKKVRR
ncbi:hypothetical protein DBV14_19795 [Variovorax sp. KBW07]|uniref:hypothetical protein n=1 Tax=Variovorax sp. KBW07 TaxID=2153358 RepID=UPI000F5749B6|nr:hypothetical protein [Variovorax sp. KBW07]RQO48635.1 hypothetical protein DBV14_19795 [Variovorax sp. KBW07]